MLLGIAVGWGCHEYAKDAQAAKELASYFSIVTDIFLRMIKMITPAGLLDPGDGAGEHERRRSVGRIGLRAMLWFVTASAISLALGMVLVNFFQPGTH